MIESLCLAGMLFGNLWSSVMSDGEKTPVTEPAVLAVPGEKVPVIELCDRPAPPGKPIARPSCDQPPDLQKILRALPSMPRGLPYIYDVFREDVEVSAEKLVDRVDPPCYFPLIGLAQLHHCHWKCTVTFTEHIDVAFPCPFEIKRRRSEVVYIDKDHLRLCMASNSDDGRNANSGSCPGGRFAGKTIPKEAAKCPSAKQVPLDLSVPPIIPSGLQSGTPAREQRDAPMTVGDVVRMSQKGISQEIILRQMELTNAIFNLTVDDIIELHDQGVTEKIIRAMQERREPSIPKLQTEPGAASRPRDPGLIHPLPPVPLFLEPGMSLSIRRR